MLCQRPFQNKLPPVPSGNFRHWGLDGSQYVDPAGKHFPIALEVTAHIPKYLCLTAGGGLVFSRYFQLNDSGKWRIIECLSETDLFLKESVIVLVSGKPDTEMTGIIGLQHDPARGLTPPGSARYLCKQLKRPFRSTKIGKSQG